MQQKLKIIKNEIINLREKSGPRANIPQYLWQQIYECSQSIPLKDVCKNIEISLNNAQIKIKKYSNTFDLDDFSCTQEPKLIQIPIAESRPRPIMEMILPGGAIIKVYSA